MSSPSSFLRGRTLATASLLLVLALLAQSSIGVAVTAASGPIDPISGYRPARAGGWGEEPPPPVERDREIETNLDRALHAALRRAEEASRAPGVTLSFITADGRQWSGGSGRDLDGGGMDPDDPVTIGSVTKTFVAAAVLALSDAGHFGLDDPVSAYLPKARIARDVTIRQLLGHTSGIGDLYRPARGRLSGSPDRPMSSNDVLGPIRGRVFAPGEGYAYSNTNYFLLGHLIEVVTHRPVESVLEQLFCEPLGLDDTRLLTEEDDELPPAWSTGFWTSGAMVSTPRELARWGRALYAGDVLSDGMRKRMLGFRVKDRYGLGAQLLTLGDREVPGHSGLLYKTTTLLVHLPDVGLTIALAGTAPHTDLERVLLGEFGGASLFSLMERVNAGA